MTKAFCISDTSPCGLMAQKNEQKITEETKIPSSWRTPSFLYYLLFNSDAYLPRVYPLKPAKIRFQGSKN